MLLIFPDCKVTDMPRSVLRTKAFEKLIGPYPKVGMKLLELGYGQGEMLCNLYHLGFRTFGYDISDQAYAATSSKLKSLGFDNIKLLVESPFRSNFRYDYITAFEVLEHVEDDLEFLNNIQSILTKGGFLIISTPAKKAKWSNNDVISGHLRRYEKDELRQLLQKSRFDVVKIWNYGYPLTIILDMMLERRARKILQNKNFSKINTPERTKISGLQTRLSLQTLIRKKHFLIYPFTLIQLLFFNRPLSTAMIALAQKRG